MFIEKYPANVQKQVKVLMDTPFNSASFTTQHVLVGVDDDCGRVRGNICHNDLRSKQVGCPQFIIEKLLHTYRNIDCVEFKQTVPYLDWLFKDSPLADFYLTDSAEEFIVVGCAVVRCDIPANLLLISLQAIRYTWEFPDLTEHWYNLVKLGVKGSHALVLCQSFNTRGGKVSWGTNSFNNNHFMFSTCASFDTLHHFTNKQWQLEEELYSEANTYKGVQHTWKEGGVVECLRGAITANIVTKTTEVKSPFGGELKVVDNAYEQVVNALNKLLESDDG